MPSHTAQTDCDHATAQLLAPPFFWSPPADGAAGWCDHPGVLKFENLELANYTI